MSGRCSQKARGSLKGILCYKQWYLLLLKYWERFISYSNNTSHFLSRTWERDTGTASPKRLIALCLSQPADRVQCLIPKFTTFNGSNYHISNSSKATVHDAIVTNLSNTRGASTETKQHKAKFFYQECVSKVLEIQTFSWCLWTLCALRKLL